MAQYKVPQDVEADDKLLGPFNFRQFVYLMVAGALIAVAAGLFQLFPLLAIIPLPPVVFFLALALPLKKDQPMETYLAAIVSYYMKPRSRVWKAGQRETAIQITAPKKVENPRTRDITGEEATHRLSFLADIVDTEGYAIKGISNNTSVREDMVAEAETAVDMFEGQRFENLATTIQKDENERHEEIVRQMQEEVETAATAAYLRPEETKKEEDEAVIVKPDVEQIERNMAVEKHVENSDETDKKLPGVHRVDGDKLEKAETKKANASIINLVNNNKDYSVETLAKEAKRIKRKEEGEIFISLH